MKQITKREFLRATGAALTALSLPVHAQAAKRQTLNILCWSEYIPQPVIDSFAQEHNAKVTVENYTTNEEMLTKLQASPAKYDLIQPSEYVIEQMVAEGRLEELDLAALPNLKNLDPNYTKMRHDPEQKFSVPWMAGSVGIVVNSQKIKEPVKSYGEFFQEKFKKRLVVLNDAREIVSWAFASLGLPLNDLSEANLAKAKEVLTKWLPLVGMYDSDNPKTSLLNGDVDLGVVWNGEAAKLIEEAKEAKGKKHLSFSYSVAADGAHRFVDSLAIPKGAKNKATAEKFMDFILQPKVSVQIWEEFPYTLVNAEGRKLLKPEQLANPASFPPAEVKFTPFAAIPKERSLALEKLVAEVKGR